MVMERDGDMDAILQVIKDRASLDLSRYKRTSLERSIARRMRARGIADVSEYASFLTRDSEELQTLVSEVTVDFSLFFRDPELFDFLQQIILPKIVLRKKASGEGAIRVWCAGCGSGEEVYSIAILLFEALKGKASRDTVAIFATDVDASSLDKSRAAVYSPESVRNVPIPTQERYFSFNGSYRVKEFIKELICFGKHDLLKNPPISRIDLLLCRNVLIYLDPQGQSVVLRKLCYAVRPGGYLVLGKSEGLSGEISDFFAVVERGEKVFQRKDGDKCPFS